MSPVPTPTQLTHCVAQLTRFIPTPPRPVAEPQASKWGVKVGQQFTHAGEPWTVTETDSLGITFTDGAGNTTRAESKDDLEQQWQKVASTRRRSSKGVQRELPGTE